MYVCIQGGVMGTKRPKKAMMTQRKKTRTKAMSSAQPHTLCMIAVVAGTCSRRR